MEKKVRCKVTVVCSEAREREVFHWLKGLESISGPYEHMKRVNWLYFETEDWSRFQSEMASLDLDDGEEIYLEGKGNHVWRLLIRNGIFLLRRALPTREELYIRPVEESGEYISGSRVE